MKIEIKYWKYIIFYQ